MTFPHIESTYVQRDPVPYKYQDGNRTLPGHLPQPFIYGEQELLPGVAPHVSPVIGEESVSHPGDMIVIEVINSYQAWTICAEISCNAKCLVTGTLSDPSKPGHLLP